jgi:hypothetical protein
MKNLLKFGTILLGAALIILAHAEVMSVQLYYWLGIQ